MSEAAAPPSEWSFAGSASGRALPRQVVTGLVLLALLAVALPLPLLGSPLGYLVNLSLVAAPLASPAAWAFSFAAVVLGLAFAARFRVALGWPSQLLAATFLFWAGRVTDWAGAVAFIPFAIGCATAVLPPLGRRAVERALVALLVLHVATGLLCYFAGYRQYVTPSFGMRASGLFGSPNTLYPITLLAVAIFGERMGAGRKMDAALFALSVGVTLLTFTRAAALGVAVYFAARACAGNLSAHQRFCWMASGGFAVLGGFLARSNFALIPDRSGLSRLRIWETALSWVGDAPAFGHGLASFDLLARAHAQGQLPHEPKNLALALLLDGGIVGLALTVAAGVSLLGSSSTFARRSRPVAYAALALGTAGLADTPVFGDALRLPGTVLFMAFAGAELARLAETLRRFGRTDAHPAPATPALAGGTP